MSVITDKPFNFGVTILRIVACCGVVSLHFGGTAAGRKLAVPIFVFLSFYLGRKLYDKRDILSTARRLARLMMPFVVWGVAGWIWFSCIDGFHLHSLMMQLLVGRFGDIPVGHLYYLEVVALITAFLFFVPRQHFFCSLLLVIVLSFILQYTGLNYAIWNKAPNDVANTFGRIVEFLPYACAGLLLSLVQEMRFVRSAKLFVVILCATILSAVVYFKYGASGCFGYSYQGVPLFLVTVSLCVTFILYSPKSNLFKGMSVLTAGVYYSHGLIGDALLRCGVGERSHCFSLVVLCVTYAFVWCVSRISRLSWLVK